jgi:hypothetical protein
MGNLWLFLIRLVPIIGPRPLPSTSTPFFTVFRSFDFPHLWITTALLSRQNSLSFVYEALRLLRFRINFSHRESCRRLVKNNKLENTCFIGTIFWRHWVPYRVPRFFGTEPNNYVLSRLFVLQTVLLITLAVAAVGGFPVSCKLLCTHTPSLTWLPAIDVTELQFKYHCHSLRQ